MKIKQIIIISIFISFCHITSAQVSEGVHYAYEIKKGQKIPEVITITVINHDEFCRKFINNKTKGLLDGKFFITLKKEFGFHIGNFSKGIPDGDWEYHTQNALQKKTYVNGKIEGDFYEYNADGTPYSETTYRGGFIQHIIYRHRNGKLNQEYFYDENGKFHGHKVIYNDEGKLIRDETYVHGKKDGPFFEYDETYGTIDEREYKNGKLIHNKTTDINGNIKYEGFYNDEGKEHGRFIHASDGYISQEEIYQNGITQQEKSFFKDGSLQSIRIYDEKGKKKYSAYYRENPYYMCEEYNYLEGEKHGLQKKFSNKNIPDEETYYHKGDEIYQKDYDRINGKINALYIVDETGDLVKVEEYNSQGKKIHKNTSYKRPSSIKLVEGASGIIDIVIE